MSGESGSSTIGPAVTTMSASSTASRGPAAPSTRSPSDPMRSGWGSQARMATSEFSSLSTWAWNRPCSPAPSTAARLQSSGANLRMQTPLAAAVRAAVISAPSMIAAGTPVSGSFRTMSPVM